MKYLKFLILVSLLQFIFCSTKTEHTQTIIAKKIIVDSTVTENYIPPIYPELVKVEGGSFMLGDTSHLVELSTFYIGKYEVTISQFRQFVNETNYLTHKDKAFRKGVQEGVRFPCGSGGGTWYQFYNCDSIPISLSCLPVVKISYDDALAYCKWLSKKLKNKYTLPSEAQWEYAAKGGKQTKHFKYIGSNKFEEVMKSKKATKMEDNSRFNNTTCVGKMLPNELGIYNMADGVSEWCLDAYRDYDRNLNKNPIQTKLLDTGMAASRVVKGGNFLNSYNIYPTDRSSIMQIAWNPFIGFRVVMIPDEK